MQKQKKPLETRQLKPKKTRFKRMRAFFANHKTLAVLICIFVLIVAGAGVAFALSYRAPVATKTLKPTTVAKTNKKETAPTKYYSKLNGIEVANASTQTTPVTAIMIENSPDARPQSGLKQAEVVYEAIAEGGITRFLALYQQHKPQLVGPVRSVRMYYVDWLAPFNASIAHVGGSYAALQEVRNGNYRDLDQFFNGSYYWRSTDRYAPHNVYTSFARLDALNAKKGYTSSQFTSFDRADGKASDTPNATSVTINFSSNLYNTHYDYDKASNTYLRSVAGQASVDREEGRIVPNVVVALHVQESTVMEDGWRQDIETTGSGQATIFQNGTATNCTWRKTNRTSPLELIDSSTGKSIALNRGQTWIAAIPNGEGGVSWQ